jgi:spore germination protein
MYKSIIIAVLALAVVGTGAWGYQQHRQKQAVLVNAENNYQRSFHDLSYRMDLLHDKIGSTLAMNSRKSLSPSLAEVWRITSEAHNDVGQLPLSLMSFNNTEEFLNNVGNFSYRTAVRDLDKEPLTDKEYGTLQKLYGQSANIQDGLRQVQYLVLKNNLHWMDVQTALANGKQSSDNTIIDGFKTIDKTAGSYSDAPTENPNFVTIQKKDENFKNLKGRTISKQEAIRIAEKYSNMKKPLKVKVTQNRKGSKYGFYSISIVDKNHNEGYLDITKKGGFPIWYIERRNIGKQKLSLNEAANKAATFLTKNHYQHMDLFESSQYDTIGDFSFVTSQNSVFIYPETIRLKVALDNGQIIGFTADDYLKAHHSRKLPKPVLSLKKARTYVNPKVKIMEERLAVVVNDLGKEVLCYEFLGTMGNDTYRIYINAKDGAEEKVDKLQNAEKVYKNTL